MGHTHSVLDSDAHFTIDPITRLIKNESSKKTTIIQFDHNSERFSFSLERYVEKHDMMLCTAVEVHFTNTDTKTGDFNADYYEVDDLQIDPVNSNKIVFSWLIDERATQYAGSLEFSIKFKCIENGVCVYRWNTANNNEISVSSGRDNSGAVVEIVASVVDQWRSQIFGDAENAVANINLAEQESIAAVQEAGEDILNAANTAEQNAKNVLANAIKGSLSGEVVTADDVSPVEHEMKVKVYGRNRLEFQTHQSFTATSTYKWISSLGWNLKKGTYIYSCTSEFGTTCRLWMYNSTGLFINIGSGESFVLSDTEAESLTDIRVVIEGLTSGEAYEGNVYPVISTSETDYTPWIDPATVNVRRCGKNLIPYPFTDTTVKRKGVTFTDNGDGTITLNGTAEATTSFVLFNGEMVVEGIYTLSGLSGGSGSSYYIQPVCSDKAHPGMTEGSKTYEWSGITLNRLQLSVVEGTVFSAVKISPILEVGDTATSFEQYKGTEHTPSSDGTVSGMMSTSPNMTILTDTEGVVVECEYIKDTNKVIQKLADALGVTI